MISLLIQYAVEEAVNSGIENLVFVSLEEIRTSIQNHFDKAYEIETELKIKNKKKELEMIQNIIPSHVKVYLYKTK